MSRHSAGGDSSAPRRSRRRAAQEEPSITEWLDSGTYGPYAADSNRADAPPEDEPYLRRLFASAVPVKVT